MRLSVLQKKQRDMKRKERKKRDVKKRRRRERDSICNSQIDFILCLTYKQGSNPTAEIENWVIAEKRFFDISSKHISPT